MRMRQSDGLPVISVCTHDYVRARQLGSRHVSVTDGFARFLVCSMSTYEYHSVSFVGEDCSVWLRKLLNVWLKHDSPYIFAIIPKARSRTQKISRFPSPSANLSNRTDSTGNVRVCGKPTCFAAEELLRRLWQHSFARLSILTSRIALTACASTSCMHCLPLHGVTTNTPSKDGCSSKESFGSQNGAGDRLHFHTVNRRCCGS